MSLDTIIKKIDGSLHLGETLIGDLQIILSGKIIRTSNE
jgi:hypothetical protein